jgi:hypothetical protein
MVDRWDYDTCPSCRHYSVTLTHKGRNWLCSLNSKPAALKKKFRMIWALEFLRSRGVDLSEDEITINFVGKIKIKKFKGENLND